LRLPLNRWPFLGLQTSLVWHNTFYSESEDDAGVRVPDWLSRQFFELRADVTGPTFTRIFDTQNRLAERLKHVIEPTLTIQRTTLIGNYDNIVKLDSYDHLYGGTTRITYGLTNRFLARRGGAAAQASAREIASVSLSQTYYTDEAASAVDPSYSTSFRDLEPRKLSPWQLTARAAPSDAVDGSLQLEYDQYEKELLSVRAGGRYARGDSFQASSGWSRRKITTTRYDNYLNAGTTLRALSGRVGGSFSFDYDFFRDQMLQRRIQAFYNAQCCGIAAEYQVYNFPGSGSFLVPRDRRFNLTFTLAGIGTFSNMFGVFGNPDSSRSR
jgi:hypothetical protein